MVRIRREKGDPAIQLSKRQVVIILVVIVLIIIVVGLLAGLLHSSNKETEPWKNLHLPSHTVPVHYDLTLYPDFYDDHAWFYGNVTITVNITKEAPHLLVHINHLNITRTELINAEDGTKIEIKRNFSYTPNQFWVIEMVSPIKAQKKVFLKLEFDGSLSNGIVGFYKSTYINSKTNETRHLATSKFEPTDARKAFPCFDEPNLKATYTTTLIHRDEYIALSNMPEISKEKRTDLDLMSTKFEKSVPMSTYLACFIVCDFLQKNTTTRNGTPFRVFATPDKIDQVDYALSIGPNISDFFEDYFDEPYPLPKQDMIAIPDFSAGAMEHWGIITYRETAMLYDPKEASTAEKQRVAQVVAHELAHMWFGNLVTMNWWDDLWLNEGFASFMEYKGINVVEPLWNIFDQFLVYDLFGVLQIDAGINSHPIVVPVSHPDEISEVFDKISYQKGSSVIRMLENFLGEEKFKEGIKEYMNNYRYGNTVTDNLWEELGKVEGTPDVKAIMDTWTRQMGFPVISVKRMGSQVEVTQERFLADKNEDPQLPKSEFKYIWKVPLTYKIPTKMNQTRWLDGKIASLDIPLSSNDVLVVNNDMKGYYRVNYETDLWQRIANALNDPAQFEQTFSPSERAMFVDDAFNLAKSGDLDYSIVLDLIQYLKRETHYVPWDSALDNLNFISKMLEKESNYGLWRKYAKGLMKHAFEKIGFQDDGTHLDKLLRSGIVGSSCHYGNKDCLGNATNLFQEWMQKEIFISPDLRLAVYKYGILEDGDEAVWDEMWDRYMKAVVPQEKKKLLYGLSKTDKIWLLHKLLEYSMDETKVRTQDFFTLMRHVSGEPIGNSVLWSWVQQHYDILLERFGTNSSKLGKLVPTICVDFNSEIQLNQVKAFFKRYPDAGAGKRARKQALGEINNNIAWMNNNKDTIISWLQNNV